MRSLTLSWLLCCGSIWIACASSSGSSAHPTSSEAPLVVSGWTRGADTVIVASRGGLGDFFRKITYSRSAGTLSVEDSDPFAGEREQHPARVVRRSRALGPDDRRRVEAILGRVQPDAAALARRCAPGGCLWIERDDGARLEDDVSVRPALVELSRLFPELREY
jgi:hypothetical protein